MRPKYDGNGQGPLETLEEPLHVNSSLGIRARIRMLGRGSELEISGTLLTVDLRIMDMSEFEVILRMDWLIAYRVVHDCERMRVTAYTQDSTRVVFQGDKHDIFPQTVYEYKTYPRGRGETRLRSTSGGLRVRECFPDKLPGLPPHRDVDFGIELHHDIFTHLYDSA